MEGEEAWGDALFEAYSSLIPVWIRNVWMKAQLMHTNNTVCERQISTREGGNMFETLLVNSLACTVKQ